LVEFLAEFGTFCAPFAACYWAAFLLLLVGGQFAFKFVMFEKFDK